MRALEFLMGVKPDKAAFGSAEGSVKNLKSGILGMGNALEKVQDDLHKFAKSQKWANIANLASNTFGGVKNIAASFKNAFQESYNFMNDFAAKGDKIAKTAKLVGMSATDYQAFSFAAQRSGMSIEELDAGLKRFNVTLGKARSGDATASKIFGSILPGNISDYKTSKDVVLALADSYQKLSTEQQAFVSQEIFGRGGLKMSEMFRGGSESVRELLQTYENLGGGISDDAAKQAEQLNDDIFDFQVTIESFKNLVGSELLPVFTEMFTTATKFFVKNKKDIQLFVRDFAGKLVEGFKQLIPKIPSVLEGVVTVAKWIGKIVDFLGPIGSIVTVGILGSLGSIVGVVTSLAGLLGGPVVAAIGLVAVGIVEAISIVKQFYDNWDMLVSFIKDDVVGGIKSAFVEVGDFVYDKLHDSILGGIADGIRSAVRAIPGIGKLIFSDVDFSAVDAEISKNDIGGNFEDMVKTTNTNTTTTNRFSVDFKNMPKGVEVNAPKNGDFDYSYGYVMGGL